MKTLTKRDVVELIILLVVLTGITLVSTVGGRALFGITIDPFYPWLLAGAAIALVRLRQMHREDQRRYAAQNKPSEQR